MAYDTKWDPRQPEKCRLEAERLSLVFENHWDNGFLYRLCDQTYASRIDPYDDSDDNWTSILKVEIIAYPIRSITPCGWTIEANNGVGYRFINKTSTKQFACPTVEEALISFVARKEKQARIYRARADRADEAANLALKGYVIPEG